MNYLKMLIYSASLLLFCSTAQAQMLGCQATIGSTPGTNGFYTFDAIGSFTNTTSFYWIIDGSGQTGQTAHYTFPGNRSYVVTLYSMDSLNNCFSSISDTINVTNAANSTCNATVTATNGANGLVDFNVAANWTGNGVSFWDFGDNSMYTYTQNPSHTYSQNGTYNACYTYYDTTSSCYFSQCLTVTVSNASGSSSNCTANISMYYNPGGSVLFNANLNNTSGFGHIFWSFGDGSSGNGSLIIAHTYTANGTYIATFHYADSITNCNITQSINVVVTNANGGSSNNCVQSINVTPGANGSFTFDAVGSFNAATSFLVWDFGDNTGDYGVTTAHTYSSTGTFNVCVTNYDSLNPCTTPTCTTVNVTSVPTGGNCVQSITVTPGANGLYSFTANFNFNPALADLVWDFGDNTAGLGVNEQHTYTATGTYTVCVTNRDTLNPCFTPTCTTVNVGSIPNTTCSANFVLFPDSTVTGLYYGYNLSTGPATMTYYWDFGDGSSSTAQYPVHNYASSGTYTICLTVLDMPSGCSATYCYTGSIVKSGIHQINILSSPLAVQQATSQTHTMLVYPNPADTYITVPAEGSLQITDATGRMVVLKDVNADARVDVSNLSPGIYYIIHQKDGAKSTGRFVKQ